MNIENTGWISPEGYKTIVRRKNRIDELREQFQDAVAKDDSSAIQAVLTEITKTEGGEIFIKNTVKSVKFEKFDTSDWERRVTIVENHVIPFCNANKIDITKKHLKTI